MPSESKIQIDSNGDSEFRKLKHTVMEIIKDSKKGNLISRRILQKLDKDILPQLGIDLPH